MLVCWWRMNWFEEHLRIKETFICPWIWVDVWGIWVLNQRSRVLISYEWSVALVRRSEISLNVGGWCFQFFKSGIHSFKDWWFWCLDGEFSMYIWWESHSSGWNERVNAHLLSLGEIESKLNLTVYGKRIDGPKFSHSHWFILEVWHFWNRWPLPLHCWPKLRLLHYFTRLTPPLVIAKLNFQGKTTACTGSFSLLVKSR